MSLFKKKSKTSPPSSSSRNNNNNNPHPPPLTPPLLDETPLSSISTMRASQSAASSISTGTGTGTGKGLPSTLSSTGSSTRSRKPSLKRIFSTKKSKEELQLQGAGTSPDGSVGKATGGGLSGWIGKRRSKDLMGYKGAGFAGAAAVEEGREREGSGSGASSAGGMVVLSEAAEQERVQLGANIDWANPSSFVSPPPHHQPFPTSMPSSSPPPPPPKVEASAGPSTPPSSLHSRRRQTSLSSISTSPSSAKDQPAAPSDRMRKASLLGLFSGAKKDGSGGSVGSRASVEVDRSTVEAESLGTTSTTTNTTTGGSGGGVGGSSERSRSRSPAGGERRKGLHTPSPSPAASASSLLPAIPTPAPHGTTDFFPPPSTPTSTFIHHQPSSPQPLPPVVSTSYGADDLASPTSVDLPLAAQPDFGTTVTTPSTSSLRTTSPNPPASASEALLQTLVLSSAKTPKVQVKLRKKDSLGSNSPVGRVRRKKVPGAGEGGEQETRSSQESSRRGSMDVARGESSPTKKTEGRAVGGAGGDEVASASPRPSSTSHLELPLLSSPSLAPIEDTAQPKDSDVVAEEEPAELTSVEAHNGSSSTSPRPSPPPSAPPTPAPTEASETFTTYVAGSLHSPTLKHTQLDESLHPAPLTFFESTDPSSSPKPSRTPTTTLLVHQAPITLRLPNPLHPFAFLLSIPLAPRLVPGFVKEWVRRERIVLDLDLGRVEEGGKRVVRTAGTVVKWGVGWWVIVPWRVGRWVVGR